MLSNACHEKYFLVYFMSIEDNLLTEVSEVISK